MVKTNKSSGRHLRLSQIILILIIIMAVLAPILAPYGPNEMGGAVNQPPSGTHLFGTDNMGRDLLSRVLYGGRVSLLIGVLSTGISAIIAVIFGTIAGLSGRRLNNLMLRSMDLLQSVPQILMVIFIQAMTQGGFITLAVAIGITGWMGMARILRNEVRKTRESDYVMAAKMMGGGFWYILRRHMVPAFLPAVLYTVISSVGAAMVTESTLSFLGLGLPVDQVSWGGLLTGAQNALLAGEWWLVFIPGLVLIVTLICITEVGEEIRKKNTRLHSNL